MLWRDFRIAPGAFGKIKDAFGLICVVFEELNKEMLHNCLGKWHL